MSILDTILEAKKKEIESLPDAPVGEPVDRSAVTGFCDAVTAKSPGFICEIKPKSPSRGDLIDRDRIPEFVNLYSKHAQAISVLCDEEFFGGSFNLLRSVAEQTTLPLLAKEFIIDQSQIRLAKHSGASAILLIVAALKKPDLENVLHFAIHQDLDVLLETHTEDEMQTALELVSGLPEEHQTRVLIGINNRDLHSLYIDLQVSADLSAIARNQLPDCTLISESGIETPEDVSCLKTQVSGFLVGTSILSSADPEEKISSLVSA